MLYVFIPTFLILIIITFFITVPALNVTLRFVSLFCVEFFAVNSSVTVAVIYKAGYVCKLSNILSEEHKK